MAAPTTVHSNGRVVVSGLPKQHDGHEQNIQGGPIAHAAARTAGSIAEQAAEAQASGATQRGSGRRRGGGVIDVPQVAEAGTIPGVSYANNQAALIGGLNQLKADAVYDNLGGTTPYKVGGRRRGRRTRRRNRIPDSRIPADDSDVVAAGKRRRRTKRHGRPRSRRSHVGNLSRRVRRVRRNSRRHVK